MLIKLFEEYRSKYEDADLHKKSLLSDQFKPDEFYKKIKKGEFTNW